MDSAEHWDTAAAMAHLLARCPGADPVANKKTHAAGTNGLSGKKPKELEDDCMAVLFYQ